MINARSNIFMVMVDEGKLWKDANCDMVESIRSIYESQNSQLDINEN
jgi:hypothetical protein